MPRFVHHRSDGHNPSHDECTCAGTEFVDNKISTTLYSIYSFLPLNLFNQFRRKANLYFLITAIISLTPYSPKTPIVSVTPLVIVLAASAIKEGLEDCARNRMDKAVNRRIVLVWRWETESWTETEWRHVAVGDLVKVNQDEAFPADLVLLSSTHPTGTGQCFIETANLDGETNLKTKIAIPETTQFIDKMKPGVEFPQVLPPAIVMSSRPNKSLNAEHAWVGNLRFEDGSETPYPLAYDQLLLRGCVLRNTAHIVGMVMFTGRETKLMLNFRNTVLKRSSLDRYVDKSLYLLFSIQAVLCSFGAIANFLWMDSNGTDSWYLMFDFNGRSVNISEEAALSFLTYLVLLDIIIPISLYVSMEMVKYAQAFLMSKDLDMYYPATDIPCQARTSGLNEELGQVKYIFSDKTGTLTGNMMNFKACSVGGWRFGIPDREDALRVDISDEKDGGSVDDEDQFGVPISPPVPFDLINGMSPPAQATGTNAGDEYNQEITHQFLLNFLLNNTVLAEPVVGGNATASSNANEEKKATVASKRKEGFRGSGIMYEAASPDEKALVEAAYDQGYVLTERFTSDRPITLTDPEDSKVSVDVIPEVLVVQIRGVEQRFELLQVVKFTSSRARMSVVVRDAQGDIYVYIKGADSKLTPKMEQKSMQATVSQPFPLRTARTVDPDNLSIPCAGAVGAAPGTPARSLWDRTNLHMTQFGMQGLRTLLIGYRRVSLHEYVTWQLEYNTAKAVAEVKAREAAQEVVEAKIEHSFRLCGATAIEDKLQDGVPDTIDKLARAGIRIWMLTGDKVETAVNIGKSCNLLKQGMHVLYITGEQGLSTAEELEAAMDVVADAQENSERFALVVTGKRLGHIFPDSKKKRKKKKKKGAGEQEEEGVILAPVNQEDAATIHERQQQFLSVCLKCKAVLCCRSSPLQKAEVVTLVKENVEGSITLAVGDGANDVSMIKSAHVGVGIAGLEGLQAVMASDYSVAQFRFLQQLILVHGAWNYKRTSMLILYSFYKNITIALTQIWFAFFSGFSAQMFYDAYAGSAFNMIFTAFPVMLAAVFNRDVSKHTALKHPELYRHNQNHSYYNMRLLTVTILCCVFQSMVLFFVPVSLFSQAQSDGTMDDQWTASTAMYTYLVMVVSIRVAFDTVTWTCWNHVFLYLSVLSWFLFIIPYTLIISITPDMYGVALRLFSNSWFYVGLVAVIPLCLIPEIVVRSISSIWFPSQLQLLQEQEKIDDARAAEAKKAAGR